MGGNRKWVVTAYGTVLAAALGWGYVGPAQTGETAELATPMRSDGPPQRLELRRVTQQMVIR
jgi:hypothetical protein